MRSLDPVWQWRLALVLAVLASISVVAGALLTASPVTAPVSPSPRVTPPPVAPSVALGTTDPNAWSRPTWLTVPTTAPLAGPPPQKKRDVRLVAIMPRKNRLVAALEVGKGMPLLFLGAGESKDGVTITSITATQVDIDLDHEHLSLTVKP